MRRFGSDNGRFQGSTGQLFLFLWNQSGIKQTALLHRCSSILQCLAARRSFNFRLPNTIQSDTIA